MTNFYRRKKSCGFYRFFSILLVFVLSFALIVPPSAAQTLPQLLNLPMPGSMLYVSPGYTPTIIRGIQIDPTNPLRFDFIIDTGDANLKDAAFKEEARKLVKYFLAALTVPKDEMWVNLSPYEGTRIATESFGVTEMGRDLLAQDYILKQLTASLVYPEDDLGKKFWDRVHKRAKKEFGTTEIPLNTFNKVWIVPETAVVYEKDNMAFVIEKHLKVMLEEDYLALEANKKNVNQSEDKADFLSAMTSDVVREILLPELEKEVNEGENFANLRQIYNSSILAAWYKKTYIEGLLAKVYVNQNKTKGIDVEDKQIKQKIFNQYVEAFKKGVYDYIKEDYDPTTQEVVARKYVSGGANPNAEDVLEGRRDQAAAEIAGEGNKNALRTTVDLSEDTAGAPVAEAEAVAGTQDAEAIAQLDTLRNRIKAELVLEQNSTAVMFIDVTPSAVDEAGARGLQNIVEEMFRRANEMTSDLRGTSQKRNQKASGKQLAQLNDLRDLLDRLDPISVELAQIISSETQYHILRAEIIRQLRAEGETDPNQQFDMVYEFLVDNAPELATKLETLESLKTESDEVLINEVLGGLQLSLAARSLVRLAFFTSEGGGEPIPAVMITKKFSSLSVQQRAMVDELTKILAQAPRHAEYGTGDVNVPLYEKSDGWNTTLPPASSLAANKTSQSRELQDAFDRFYAKVGLQRNKLPSGKEEDGKTTGTVGYLIETLKEEKPDSEDTLEGASLTALGVVVTHPLAKKADGKQIHLTMSFALSQKNGEIVREILSEFPEILYYVVANGNFAPDRVDLITGKSNDPKLLGIRKIFIAPPSEKSSDRGPNFFLPVDLDSPQAVDGLRRAVLPFGKFAAIRKDIELTGYEAAQFARDNAYGTQEQEELLRTLDELSVQDLELKGLLDDFTEEGYNIQFSQNFGGVALSSGKVKWLEGKFLTTPNLNQKAVIAILKAALSNEAQHNNTIGTAREEFGEEVLGVEAEAKVFSDYLIKEGGSVEAVKEVLIAVFDSLDNTVVDELVEKAYSLSTNEQARIVFVLRFYPEHANAFLAGQVSLSAQRVREVSDENQWESMAQATVNRYAQAVLARQRTSELERVDDELNGEVVEWVERARSNGYETLTGYLMDLDNEINEPIPTEVQVFFELLTGNRVLTSEEKRRLVQVRENYPVEVTATAAAELFYRDLPGMDGLVDDYIKSEATMDVILQDLLALFKERHNMTERMHYFQEVIDMLEARISSSNFDVLTKQERKQITMAIKDTHDVFAKRIFERTAKESSVIVPVRASEGFGLGGRDSVDETLHANEVVAPEELSGETARIQAAINVGLEYYVSNEGKVYLISDTNVDVVEGTNPTVAHAKKLTGGVDDAGGTSTQTSGMGVRSLGNTPDGYMGAFIKNFGSKEMAREFNARTLEVDGITYLLKDPELYAAHPEKIFEYLKALAEMRGVALEDLQEKFIIMSRPREEALMNEIRKLQETMIPGLSIVENGVGIEDGTVPHGLKAAMTPEMVASLGKGIDYQNTTYLTIGGSAESFMTLGIAGALKEVGAVTGVRIYSAEMNLDQDGNKVKDQSLRYAGFTEEEMVEIRQLRPEDAEEILIGTGEAGKPANGRKLFTEDSVVGGVVGAFAFINNNQVFQQLSPQMTEDGMIEARVLRVGRVEGEVKVEILTRQFNPEMFEREVAEEEQRKANDTVAEEVAQFNLPTSDAAYVSGLLSDYRAQQSPETRRPDLKIGDNFKPSAMMSEKERHDLLGGVDYASEIVNDPLNVEAAQRVRLVANAMDGGIGKSTKREEYVQRLFGRGLNSKGMDLAFKVKAQGVDSNGNRKEFEVTLSTTELKVLRALKMALILGEVVFQELVNDETMETMNQFFDEVYVYDRIDERPNAQKRTYRQVFEETEGISLEDFIEQAKLPTIDKETGRLTDRFKAPGGHGYWGTTTLSDALDAELPEGQVTLRTIYNGDGVNNFPDEHVLGWMARNNIPMIMMTTTKTPLDKKGGQMGISQERNGQWRPNMMELAQAKKVEQESLFEEMGLTEGEAGAQYFNTNVAVVNYSVLQPFLRELRGLIGESLFNGIISPTLLENENKDQGVVQLEGAMGHALLNLNAYVTTADNQGVQVLMKKYGFDKLLYLVNYDAVNRTKVFTPTKFGHDHVLYAHTDHFAVDLENAVIVNMAAPHLPDFEYVGDYYKADVQNAIDALDGVSMVGLDSLTLGGMFHLQNAVLRGTVITEGETTDGSVVDLNTVAGNEAFPRTEDGRIILENVKVIVDDKGVITVVPIKFGATSLVEDGQNTISQLRSEINTLEVEVIEWEFLLAKVSVEIKAGKMDSDNAKLAGVASNEVLKRRERLSQLRQQLVEMEGMLRTEVLVETPLVEFGTSGHRGVNGSANFDMAMVRRIAQGNAEHIVENIPDKTQLIVFDTRKNNLEYAHQTASIYAANGIKVVLIDAEATPTPVAAIVASFDDEIGGVTNFTASHSPASDSGFKFSPEHGGASDKTITDSIQNKANAAKEYKTVDFEEAKKSGLIVIMLPALAEDMYVNYYIIPTLKETGAWDDIIAYIQSNEDFRIVLDPMQGTGVRYLRAIYTALAQASGRDFFEMINADNTDTDFKQVNGAPQPDVDASNESLRQNILAQLGKAFGVSVDGDSDRFGFVDFNGEFVGANVMIALFTYFLAKDSGLYTEEDLKEMYVGKTVATSNFTNAVADHLGMQVDELAVGFKNFVEKIVKGERNYLVAGEESAHVGVGPFMKSWDDGIAIGLMGLWLVAKTGKSLTEYKKHVEGKIGKEFFIQAHKERTNIPEVDEANRAGANEVIAQTREEKEKGISVSNLSVVKTVEGLWADSKVVDVITLDGVKIVFESGDWLLLRPSGTEPAVKVYDEVTNSDRLQALLEVGLTLMRQGIGGGPEQSAAEVSPLSFEERVLQLGREFRAAPGQRGAYEKGFFDGDNERGGWVNRPWEIQDSLMEEIENRNEALRDRGITTQAFIAMGGESSIVGPSDETTINISSTSPEKIERYLLNGYVPRDAADLKRFLTERLATIHWNVVSKSGGTRETGDNFAYIENIYRWAGLDPMEHMTYFTDPGDMSKNKIFQQRGADQDRLELIHREQTESLMGNNPTTSVGGRNTLVNVPTLIAYAWRSAGNLKATIEAIKNGHTFKDGEMDPWISSGVGIAKLMQMKGRNKIAIIQSDANRGQRDAFQEQNPEESLGKNDSGFTVYANRPDMATIKRMEDKGWLFVELKIEGTESETEEYANQARINNIPVYTIAVKAPNGEYAAEVSSYGWMKLVATVGAVTGTNISDQPPVEAYKSLLRDRPDLDLKDTLDSALKASAVLRTGNLTILIDGLLNQLNEDDRLEIRAMQAAFDNSIAIYARLLEMTRGDLDAITLGYYGDVDDATATWLNNLSAEVLEETMGYSAKWAEGSGDLHGLFVNQFAGPRHQIPTRIISTQQRVPFNGLVPELAYDAGAKTIRASATAAHMSLRDANRPSVLMIVEGELNKTTQDEIQAFWDDVSKVLLRSAAQKAFKKTHPEMARRIAELGRQVEVRRSVDDSVVEKARAAFNSESGRNGGGGIVSEAVSNDGQAVVLATKTKVFIYSAEEEKFVITWSVSDIRSRVSAGNINELIESVSFSRGSHRDVVVRFVDGYTANMSRQEAGRVRVSSSVDRESGRATEELVMPTQVKQYLESEVGNIIFVGRPSAGKGTVIDWVKDNIEGVEVVGTGDYFRGIDRIVKNEKEPGDDEKYGQLVALLNSAELDLMTAGKLMSDETTVKVVNAILDQEQFKQAQHLIFDGFSRTVVQWNLIRDGKIMWKGEPLGVSMIVEIDTPADVIQQRASIRRQEALDAKREPRRDDNPEKVVNRLAEYEEYTAPMISQMRKSIPENMVVVNGYVPDATVEVSMRTVRGRFIEQILPRAESAAVTRERILKISEGVRSGARIRALDDLRTDLMQRWQGQELTQEGQFDAVLAALRVNGLTVATSDDQFSPFYQDREYYNQLASKLKSLDGLKTESDPNKIRGEIFKLGLKLHEQRFFELAFFTPGEGGGPVDKAGRQEAVNASVLKRAIEVVKDPISVYERKADAWKIIVAGLESEVLAERITAAATVLGYESERLGQENHMAEALRIVRTQGLTAKDEYHRVLTAASIWNRDNIQWEVNQAALQILSQGMDSGIDVNRRLSAQTVLEFSKTLEEAGLRRKARLIVNSPVEGASRQEVSKTLPMYPADDMEWMEDGDIASGTWQRRHAERASDKIGPSGIVDNGNGDRVGGIDLNPDLLNLQIKRDGNGVPLPLNMQLLENMNIEGFYPVIINIVPVNVPFLLGLVDTADDETDSVFDLDPFDRKAKLEELSSIN